LWHCDVSRFFASGALAKEIFDERHKLSDGICQTRLFVTAKSAATGSADGDVGELTPAFCLYEEPKWERPKAAAWVGIARAISQGVCFEIFLNQVGEVPGGGYKPESSERKLSLLFFFLRLTSI
jgi:hypothetical protein